MKKLLKALLVIICTLLIVACTPKKEEDTTNGDNNSETIDNTTPKDQQDGTAGSNIPIKDNAEEAKYQIEVAAQYIFEEIYGDKVNDARIYVDKIYTAEEEQEDPTLKDLNLGPDEVAFKIKYDLHPAEGTDVNELLIPNGDYDSKTGWVVDKISVGVLRPNEEGKEPEYVITDFGSGF